MIHSRVHIESGDLVIVYLSRDNLISVVVTPGQVLHNKYGRYLHDDMIGQKFGTRMTSPPPHSGYIHLLRPTAELWTLSLPHRTQILYAPDISYITMKLGVRPGARVIEAGTGSGSMTHALSRSVGSSGSCYSYEYHLQRYEKAKEEFISHHLDNVHLSHRNVCKDGFGDVEDVDAVFLDLPAPWDAIPHARKVLNPNTLAKICCFSPCLEQVLKTVFTLRSEGFEDIYTQEVLSRHHELPNGHPSSTASSSSVSASIERLRQHEKRKAERRRLQMKNAREKARQQMSAANWSQSSSPPAPHESSAEALGHTNALKRPPTGEDGEEEHEPENKRARMEEGPTTADDTKGHFHTKTWSEPDFASDALLSKPYHEMRGHTSYLTFASFHPAVIRRAREGVAGDAVGRGDDAQETGSGPAAAAAAVAGAGVEDEAEATEYGSDGFDEVMGTMTEDDLQALTGET
ncbi:tRNA methyltransferase complex GCD14 subunit-domain-containing protein [Kockovaella imperatae]|uniref:tRNA (adenine(58)-N(1))-methyltransferase catalytic subunit TRM61 n=1 Tax=Kockovaella imperatae TaxID=4999 RepID=A0A1Y1UG15_9TREE|nr:tRNA methyltransferase complex GCD14 subunit-domain-containing protein [Kockovaella imperatae]ORX36456.1 tRNA methyltransferase complex GCD14 subunit-domain-containing protein [Kockovaella imperatae]